jgi:hypothetical protein
VRSLHPLGAKQQISDDLLHKYLKDLLHRVVALELGNYVLRDQLELRLGLLIRSIWPQHRLQELVGKGVVVELLKDFLTLHGLHNLENFHEILEVLHRF